MKVYLTGMHSGNVQAFAKVLAVGRLNLIAAGAEAGGFTRTSRADEVRAAVISVHEQATQVRNGAGKLKTVVS